MNFLFDLPIFNKEYKIIPEYIQILKEKFGTEIVIYYDFVNSVFSTECFCDSMCSHVGNITCPEYGKWSIVLYSDHFVIFSNNIRFNNENMHVSFSFYNFLLLIVDFHFGDVFKEYKLINTYNKPIHISTNIHDTIQIITHYESTDNNYLMVYYCIPVLKYINNYTMSLKNICLKNFTNVNMPQIYSIPSHILEEIKNY